MKNRKAIILFILTIVSMILGFLKESAVVYTLGSTWKADVFIYASNLPILLFSAVGTVISTTFMPIYTEIRLNESNDEANSFASKFGLLVIIFCVLITFFVIIFPNVIVKIMAPGLQEINNINNITRLVMPSIIFLGITSVVVGTLESHNYVEAATARQIPFNITLIISMILVYNLRGLNGSIVMIVVATIFQLIFVLVYSKKISLKYRKSTKTTSKFIKRSLKMMGPMAIGVMAMQINSMVSMNFASRLGVGSITKLNLANKLNMASYNTLGYLIVVLIFPILSKYAAEKKYKKIGESLTEGIVKALLIMLPIIVIIFMLSRDIVSLFFGSEKFTIEDIILTSNVLRCYLLGLIFWAIKDILNRGYYSLKETKISMINGVVTVVVNIILSIFLMWRFEIIGLAMATSISSLVSVILLMKNLRKIRIKLNYKYILKGIYKLLISVSIMIFVYLFIIKPYVPVELSKIELLIKISVISLLLLVIYASSLYILSKDSLKMILKK